MYADVEANEYKAAEKRYKKMSSLKECLKEGLIDCEDSAPCFVQSRTLAYWRCEVHVHEFLNRPGLYIITNAFSREMQIKLSYECVRNYSSFPFKNNLGLV